MIKIVINKCHGGFGLSEKAMVRYAEIKNIPLFIEKDKFGHNTYWTIPKEKRIGFLKDIEWYSASDDKRKLSNELYSKNTISYMNIERTDPVLIQVVEELGQEANDQHSYLAIEELPKGTKYRIMEYDGAESIETQSSINWDVA